jgi:hypothetical protein
MPPVKDQQRAGEAQRWVETVLGRKFNDFFEEIRDGVALCELLNKIAPGTCKKFKKSNVVYVCRTNIQIYLKGCEKLGVPQTDRFETRDLYDQQRLDMVVNNLFMVSAKSRDVQSFGGPYIGIKYASKNKRQFTQEVLNKSKSAVPIWNQGDKNHKKEEIDGYGIIKGKDTHKHTGVQSSWEKGSKKNDLSGGHDSYGIVSVKGMEKHSGVQSKWEQGSNKNDLSGGHDSYGIVSVKGMEKHSGVQSTWEKGSNKNDLSGGHDSYGIVSVKGMEKHTGVQSTWEKGSNKNDLSGGHDSYGIVSVKGTDKHTGVQSGWEKGSLQNDLSGGHDSYGIVSVKGTDKHTGVQSGWEKGSNQTDTSSGHDSYGVVQQPSHLSY